MYLLLLWPIHPCCNFFFLLANILWLALAPEFWTCFCSWGHLGSGRVITLRTALNRCGLRIKDSGQINPFFYHCSSLNPPWCKLSFYLFVLQLYLLVVPNFSFERDFLSISSFPSTWWVKGRETQYCWSIHCCKKKLSFTFTLKQGLGQ